MKSLAPKVKSNTIIKIKPECMLLVRVNEKVTGFKWLRI